MRIMAQNVRYDLGCSANVWFAASLFKPPIDNRLNAKKRYRDDETQAFGHGKRAYS